MSQSPTTPLLEARGLTKRFGAFVALDRADLRVHAGEVVALMGQNGAGKSTLVKLLSGVHVADAGSIHVRGKPFVARSPSKAQLTGIATVFQEVNLLPNLSVAENLFIGRPRGHIPGWLIWRSQRRMAARARKILARYGLEIDVHRSLGSFSIATRQLVAIARAIDMDARVLILDEPTSSLDEAECERLFRTMDSLRKSGVGMIFVTHFLDQVYRVSDRIVVLRNGRIVGDATSKEMPRMKLVELMLGRAMETMPVADTNQQLAQQWTGRPARSESLPARSGERAWELFLPTPKYPRFQPANEGVLSESEISSQAQTPDPLVNSMQPRGTPGPLIEVKQLSRIPSHAPFDLHVNRGEVVGLAGLLGSGRTESARLVFGADKSTSGKVIFRSKRIRPGSPRASIACGMGFCSEDRKAEGIFPGLSVRENLTMVVQRTLSKAGILNRTKQRQIAAGFIARLGIAVGDMEQPIETLSGGNQQKVLLARWLAAKTELLILDEPTRGIDVGARAEIERLIRDFVRTRESNADPTGRDARSTGVVTQGAGVASSAGSGCDTGGGNSGGEDGCGGGGDGRGVLLISSELDELARLCSRAYVLRHRRVVASLDHGGVTETSMMKAIAEHTGDA